MIKLKGIKILIKKKIKKLKINVPNQNILYIQIKYKKLN